MKIPSSIRIIFDSHIDDYRRLREIVDKRISGIKDRRWHYESRVKELESYALKLETGRVVRPEAMEDFFACTLVVANIAERAKAEELLERNFRIHSRRPEVASKTHKTPSSFPFDDLRIYGSLPVGPAHPETGLEDLEFEIQVKTFLQHAWAIATHDLIYKSDSASWSRERIAYQIKAMLEHAELTIAEANSLAECAALAMEDRRTEHLRSRIDALKQHWNADELPRDIRRLADNVNDLIRCVGISGERLDEILNEARLARPGGHPKNLSPFGAIVSYLFEAERTKIVAYLENARGKKRVLIPAEVVVPKDVDTARLVNAVFVGG